MFQPENQTLPDFLEDLQESAEKAFGEAAPQMIESLLYAKMPPHLKKSVKTEISQQCVSKVCMLRDQMKAI